MAQVYIARLSSWLEKRWNTKGSPVVTDIEPALRVTAAWPVGNEDRYLQGYNRFCTASQQAAVAAQFAAEQLRNPAGSNVIAVLERIVFFESAADQINLSRASNNPADLTTPINAPAPIDSRSLGNSALILSKQSLVSVTDLGLGIQTGAVSAANIGYDFVISLNQEYTLLPGQALRMCAQAANTALTVVWMWRERSLELSELT